MITEEIFDSILKTTKPINETLLPDQQGIYAFMLNEAGDLGIFGSSGQIIYVGLSEKSLNSRDSKTHNMSGQTGWSSLRRSLGAILKTQLNLTAIKRDKNPTKIRPDKYKFDEEGEQRLTQWMAENLKLGYWTIETPLALKVLRKEEELVILKTKPTLDLDSRTKKFNVLSVKLDNLRKICREEVKNNS